MADISAKQVMEFMKKTGVPMMQCKKALIEANGDEDEALKILREKGMATAAKKADRIAALGLVTSNIFDDGKTGVILEVNCETDFVAKTDAFKGLVQTLAEQIAVAKPANVDELLQGESIKEAGRTVNELVAETVSKCGEKISVRRFERIAADGSMFDTYIHMGGQIGVLLEIAGADASDEAKAIFHTISMHIAAANPPYLCREDVPADVIEKEKEIAKAQALNEGKKEQFVDKIVMGRINKYYKENCLLEQVSMLDQENTITALLAKAGDFSIKRFVRYQMGEGIEKRQDNFAEEVMGQMVK